MYGIGDEGQAVGNKPADELGDGNSQIQKQGDPETRFGALFERVAVSVM
jgi:hypothetical protein